MSGQGGKDRPRPAWACFSRERGAPQRRWHPSTHSGGRWRHPLVDPRNRLAQIVVFELPDGQRRADGTDLVGSRGIAQISTSEESGLVALVDIAAGSASTLMEGSAGQDRPTVPRRAVLRRTTGSCRPQLRAGRHLRRSHREVGKGDGRVFASTTTRRRRGARKRPRHHSPRFSGTWPFLPTVPCSPWAG